MCNFLGKLVAWMDGELPEGEAAPVEEHLKECAECRVRLANYRQASDEFAAYCEAVTAAEVPPRRQRGVPLWALGAIGAAAAALLFALGPKRITPTPAQVANPLAAQAGRAVAPAAIAAPRSSSALGVRSVAGPDAVAEHATRSLASAHRTGRERILATGPAGRPDVDVPANPTAYLANEGTIEIAISSDEIFPEGAMPQGVSFVADVTLGADGTAERLRLQPRMVRFARRTVRP